MTEENIEKLFAVFDLNMHHDDKAPSCAPTRIMLSYDKAQNRKEFVVLNKELSNDMSRKIVLWLEEHMDIPGLHERFGTRDNEDDLWSYRT